MKHSIIGVAILTLVAAGPASAAQKPKGGQPKTHTVSSKSVVKTQPSGKSSLKLQGKSSVKPVKSKTSLKVKTSPATTKTTVKTSKKTSTSPTTTTTTTTTTSGPTTTVTLSPVQQKLKQNTNLAAKLRSRLPAGTDLMTAAAGFKNLGQFVSTVNASYNHELSFDGLKRRIVYENMSLGQAMQDMK